MNRRMSFPDIDNELRTDLSFRNRDQPAHHRGRSLLEDLPVDMVNDFIIADPLHLLDLGVMRKLLRIWIEGTVTKNFKLSNNDKIMLDNKFSSTDLPSEIHRTVRSIQWLKFWKGSEYRTILLYVGITAFKNILAPDAYAHFIYLFCAVTICSCESYKKFVPKAKDLFTEFVEKYIDLYGLDAITINVHNLRHVTENVERFGNLNSISTYPFENAARHIKLKLKQCDKALEQVSRRILELASIKKYQSPKNTYENVVFKFPIHAPFENSNIPRYNYVCVKKSIIFSNRKEGDKWFMTKKNEIVQFNYAYTLNDELFFCGIPLNNKSDYFVRPFNSRFINVFECKIEFEIEKQYPIDQVKCKMFISKHEGKLVFVPILHSLDILKGKFV